MMPRNVRRQRPITTVFAAAGACLAAQAAASKPLVAQGACPAAVARPSLPRGAPGVSPDEADRQPGGWAHAFERAFRGVGMLEPVAGPTDRPPGADWVPEVSIPFYSEPFDATPSLWMHRGWWVPGGESAAELRPVTYRGMMETGYEVGSLVIVAIRDDGWLQVYVDIGPIPRAASDGVLWTHACLLDLGEAALEVRRWEEVFRGAAAPPLSFLGTDEHWLRSSPEAEAEALAPLGADDEVVVLEFRGDWARVRALIPGVFLKSCLGEAWEGRSLQGWIRWREPEAGTLLWYPTRGC